jgi:uncharacterized protein (TIGR02145 family)
MIESARIIWAEKNLDVTCFRNGDEIFHAQSIEEWKNCGINSIPAWCHSGGDSNQGLEFGKLYNWFVIIDPREVAPEGWKIPSASEWNAFVNEKGGSSSAGKNMKSEMFWKDGGNGTNSSGFNGYPGGYRDSKGIYPGVGKIEEFGFWWSVSEIDYYHARGFSLANCLQGIYETRSNKGEGLSVRCIQEY